MTTVVAVPTTSEGRSTLHTSWYRWNPKSSIETHNTPTHTLPTPLFQQKQFTLLIKEGRRRQGGAARLVQTFRGGNILPPCSPLSPIPPILLTSPVPAKPAYPAPPPLSKFITFAPTPMFPWNGWNGMVVPDPPRTIPPPIPPVPPMLPMLPVLPIAPPPMGICKGACICGCTGY